MFCSLQFTLLSPTLILSAPGSYLCDIVSTFGMPFYTLAFLLVLTTSHSCGFVLYTISVPGSLLGSNSLCLHFSFWRTRCTCHIDTSDLSIHQVFVRINFESTSIQLCNISIQR
ncbi:hypothetical protein F5878DRAFT_189875 [Lentinula raphanica]|uniref:Uncharacterized protein n=1 Tax=Lentinula raphanica TaxID=153919 RepID=A0AA38P810_9AGAR|nr:hypothetical protein C8R42DRAFT_190115 [Lentinula raphanica]KAJ3838024.1 hypothetical protein F5878DRAFT_189875 [Lentinula raphanica]